MCLFTDLNSLSIVLASSFGHLPLEAPCMNKAAMFTKLTEYFFLSFFLSRRDESKKLSIPDLETAICGNARTVYYNFCVRVERTDFPRL